jgi:exodeoxyribonuclease V alpha subunit
MVLADEDESGILAPDLESWLVALRGSSLVGRDDTYRPLVLENDRRLYLYRYRNLEDRLATALRRRAEAPEFAVDLERLEQLLSVFFPIAVGAIDQRAAATLAVRRPFAVIGGGPGTGKTTTVVRVLALLQQLDAVAPERVALAAPTGKAAVRLSEAVAQGADMPELAGVALPQGAATVHRLLGLRGGGRPPNYGPDNLLPCDVLVVDEASMLDLALMVQLIEALPPRARLILLGDSDQLASIEAGAVLGDISAASKSKPLAGSMALLNHSWRFAQDSHIGRLAAAVKKGDTDAVMTTLSARGQTEVIFRPLTKRSDLEDLLMERPLSIYAEVLRQAVGGAPPEAVFESLFHLRVLSAHRSGLGGVNDINQLIEKQLMARGLLQAEMQWYPGRPVMIGRNDYGLRLFNGDIGVMLPDPERSDQLRVTFPRPGGGWRTMSSGRLPEHETVYAMTVHKSQGSEFNCVIVVLPEKTSPVLSRELLYTAVTRATTRLEIWGSEDVLLEAINRRAQRASGLKDRLCAT